MDGEKIFIGVVEQRKKKLLTAEQLLSCNLKVVNTK